MKKQFKYVLLEKLTFPIYHHHLFLKWTLDSFSSPYARVSQGSTEVGKHHKKLSGAAPGPSLNVAQAAL